MKHAVILLAVLVLLAFVALEIISTVREASFLRQQELAAQEYREWEQRRAECQRRWPLGGMRRARCYNRDE